MDATMYLKATADKRRPPMSRFTRTVLSLLVIDVCFVLFMTFGAVFPSRMAVGEPGQALPDHYYVYTAKKSPLETPQQQRRKLAKAAVPVISARSGNAVEQYSMHARLATQNPATAR